LLAFPTAEGFGKKTVGGRGGFVYEVTNLNDSGPGSLREALGGPGPRTVVFRVSGTIELKSTLSVQSYTTIAGQTAPGDGITLKGGQLAFKGTQIIMRYFRARLGDQSGGTNDAVHGSGNSSHMILDHISASWSIDEALSFYDSDMVTMQWCLVAEPLNFSTHEKGDHGYGGLWGGPRNTHHHNLFAHCSSRTPRFKGNSDYRNNVAYNWVINSSYGGGPENGLEFNLVANYYKPGPATPAGEMRHRIAEPFGGVWYVTDNFVFGNPAVTANNWNGGVQGTRSTRVDKPFPFEPINQQTAEDAFESVLAYAGCSFPKRDSIDARVVQEVRDGTAKYGNNGIIDSPNDVGGWPVLQSLPAPVDSDHDGMPDDWEKANGLDPADPKDRNQTYGPGYTMLEKYINSLVSY
jgi:pectate lyase